MSRADWSFLEQLLEEGQDWLTGAGRVGVTVLFLFRLLVLGAAAESVWDDEQEDFVCNTRQPGCTSVCYDKAFPISHFRYFVMQVIFVSTPTIFYFGYVAARVVKEKKEAESGGGEDGGGEKGKREEEEEEEKKGVVGPPKLRGRLLCAYTSSVVLKVLLEAGFMAGLWLLYGGLVIRPRFQCVRWPCPHTVDCFVSRPTEKTVFTVYTQAAAALSLLLNLAELTHLLWRALSRRGGGAQGRTPEGPDPREGGRLQHLPAPPGEPSYPRRYADPGSEDNWGPGGAGDDDLLPSYLNCVGGGARGAPHCPRAPGPQKHTAGPHQDKGPHQGHGKHKHYV